MVVFCKSVVDEYEELYKKEKLENDLRKVVIEALDKKIEKLEKENKAYKILLTKELNK